MEKDEVVDRWAEYVKELYRDETRGEDASIDRSQMESEVYTLYQGVHIVHILQEMDLQEM